MRHATGLTASEPLPDLLDRSTAVRGRSSTRRSRTATRAVR